MKFLDLLKMSLGNLARRRLRTSLTILGVIIGTTSVVMMISLGIGLDDMTTKALQEYGSLTAITVYMEGDIYSMAQKKNPRYLKDEVLAEFASMPHVKGVSPILETSAILKQGIWEASVTVTGVSREYMQNMKLGQGSLPEEGAKSLSYIFGNAVITNFYNTKTNRGYYDNMEIPDVDLMNKPLFTIFNTEAYHNFKNNVSAPDGTKVSQPKKYIIPTAAMIAGKVEDYNQHSYGIYVDIDALKAQLKKEYRNKPIPGQPLTKKNKPLKFFVYSSAQVYVDDMKNVMAVQKEIQAMGFQATSNMEWLEQSKQQSRMIQAFLGGIGAISLLVAAIGIANTMMMSIYERTKEIGIMKVLGCDMNRIRDMFLIESAGIGFFGGAIGLGLSFLLAFVINKMGVAESFIGMAGDLSQIPLWLGGFALIFSTLIGMIAGFFPALRAMRLSPLAALRNE